MPEIWLNYGVTDVVLDIKAENLDQQIETRGSILDESALNSKLDEFDISKPFEIAVLQNSKSVQQMLSLLFKKCEEKSVQIPKVFADKRILNQLKEQLPQGSAILPFENNELSNSNLVFVDEIEFDGLFGFESAATRLIKKFGQEQMLSAYEKRNGDLPCSGQEVPSLEIAKQFSNNFEILAIELATNSKGITDIAIGHPSSTLSISKKFVSEVTKEVDTHRTLIISTGKDSSNDTLGKSLSSLWNCYEAIKNDGLAILLGECKNGIGSEAIQQFIEGRLNPDKINNATKYIEGMEDLLYLTELQKKFQVGLVSVLPEFYSKKLNIVPFNGIKQVMDYLIKIKGVKHKISIISDGARILLKRNT